MSRRGALHDIDQDMPAQQPPLRAKAADRRHRWTIIQRLQWPGVAAARVERVVVVDSLQRVLDDLWVMSRMVLNATLPSVPAPDAGSGLSHARSFISIQPTSERTAGGNVGPNSQRSADTIAAVKPSDVVSRSLRIDS